MRPLLILTLLLSACGTVEDPTSVVQAPAMDAGTLLDVQPDTGPSLVALPQMQCLGTPGLWCTGDHFDGMYVTAEFNPDGVCVQKVLDTCAPTTACTEDRTALTTTNYACSDVDYNGYVAGCNPKPWIVTDTVPCTTTCVVVDGKADHCK